MKLSNRVGIKSSLIGDTEKWKRGKMPKMENIDFWPFSVAKEIEKKASDASSNPEGENVEAFARLAPLFAPDRVRRIRVTVPRNSIRTRRDKEGKKNGEES